MNFIFDIGNVLLEFKPEEFLQELFPDISLARKMKDDIFESPEWIMMDQGLITRDEATGIFHKREPDYRSAINYTMEKLPDMMTPMPDTIELLPEIKRAGHKLYYLSNYHKELRDIVVKKNQFFTLFDGGVFSCDVHMVKPSPEMYRCFLETYGLSGEDCLFFDDVEENITAAQAVGVNGVLFTGSECVKAYIDSA